MDDGMEDKEPGTIHLGFRADPELRERVDEVAEKMGQHSGIGASRSRVLKLCVMRHLTVLEEMYG
jgi:hypothetical protein